MYIDGAVITVMSAQEIANIIQRYFTTRERVYFKLVVRDSRGVEQEYWARPLLDESPFRLQDVSQVISCETINGRGLSIIVPRQNREFQPATVVFARNTEIA